MSGLGYHINRLLLESKQDMAKRETSPVAMPVSAVTLRAPARACTICDVEEHLAALANSVDSIEKPAARAAILAGIGQQMRIVRNQGDRLPSFAMARSSSDGL